MANFKMFAAIFTIVNIILFGVFCYLMSTVNPIIVATTEPITEGSTDESTEATSKAAGRSNVKSTRQIDNSGNKNHTNQRMLTEIKKNNNSSNAATILLLLNDSKHRNPSRMSTFTTKKSIYHRIYEILNNNLASPSTARKFQTFVNFRGNNTTNTTNSSDLVDPTSRTTIHYPLKGFRRSVHKEDDLPISDVKSDSVILKIKDHNGRPRIEIKLIPVKNSPETNNGYDNEPKSKAEFNMYVLENDSLSVSGDLPKSSVVQFKPNKTFTVNDVSFITAKSNESLSVFSEFDDTIGSSDSNEINEPESSDIPTDIPMYVNNENVTIFLTDQLDMTESNHYFDTTVGDSVLGDESKLTSQNSVVNMEALSDVSEEPNTYADISNVMTESNNYFDSTVGDSVDGDESKLISQNSVVNMKALYDQASDVSEKPNTYENIPNVMTESNNYFDSTVGGNVAGDESKIISQNSVINMKALNDQASDVSEKPNSYENISNVMTESNNYFDSTVGDNVAGDESKIISQNSVINMKALNDQASDVGEKPNTYENISHVIQGDDQEFDEHGSFSTVPTENDIVSSYLSDSEHSEDISKTENISGTIDSHTLLIHDVVYENDSSIELTTSNRE